ncbi:hypothetical protein HYH03_009586 [Edaphochlamys debaryana]|uniref:SRCR domain-containing protein n=1 Tax=Edaphochlamys debaryana TaxID=47281 RepID=A0A835XVV3_9CHLO|nr:hypothetical protein HYH03_009586 [Edaphochlamys debaryana]|eukprot:KAG2492092.1 hypothetical protein HYH03_009586 [Edaphochlamys debaryana]
MAPCRPRRQSCLQCTWRRPQQLPAAPSRRPAAAKHAAMALAIVLALLLLDPAADASRPALVQRAGVNGGQSTAALSGSLAGASVASGDAGEPLPGSHVPKPGGPAVSSGAEGSADSLGSSTALDFGRRRLGRRLREEELGGDDPGGDSPPQAQPPEAGFPPWSPDSRGPTVPPEDLAPPPFEHWYDDIRGSVTLDTLASELVPEEQYERGGLKLWRPLKREGVMGYVWAKRILKNNQTRWYPVCVGSRWTDREAGLTCRLAGFTNGGRASAPGSSAGSTISISDRPYITNMRCPSGATSLANCTAAIVPSGFCSSVVAVLCDQGPLPFPKIANSFTPYAFFSNSTFASEPVNKPGVVGYVWATQRVRRATYWYRVCQPGWTDVDAALSCIQAGFPAGGMALYDGRTDIAPRDDYSPLSYDLTRDVITAMDCPRWAEGVEDCTADLKYGALCTEFAAAVCKIGSCTEIAGYIVMADVAPAATDDPFGSEPLRSPAGRCATNESCMGFVTTPGAWGPRGRLFSAVYPALPSPGACLYRKEAEGCPDVPGFAVAPDVDSVGRRLSTSTYLTLEDAAAACLADPRCRGFNSEGSLLLRVSPLVSRYPGFCLYTRIRTSCPQRPGFVALPDMGHTGNRIPNAPPPLPTVPLPSPPVAPMPAPTPSGPYGPGPGVYGVQASPPAAYGAYGSFGSPPDDDGGEEEPWEGAEAEKRCRDLGAACGGFSSTGDLMHVVLPTRPSPGTCLYVREAVEEPLVGLRPGTPCDDRYSSTAEVQECLGRIAAEYRFLEDGPSSYRLAATDGPFCLQRAAGQPVNAVTGADLQPCADGDGSEEAEAQRFAVSKPLRSEDATGAETFTLQLNNRPEDTWLNFRAWGGCLVAAAVSGEGLALGPCDGNSGSMFSLHSDGEGFYQVRTAAGLCWSIDPTTAVYGAYVTTTACRTGDENQGFALYGPTAGGVVQDEPGSRWAVGLKIDLGICVFIARTPGAHLQAWPCEQVEQSDSEPFVLSLQLGSTPRDACLAPPAGWCGEGADLAFLDCESDGALDAVCVGPGPAADGGDAGAGVRGAMLSSRGCDVEGPQVPSSWCPDFFPAGPTPGVPFKLVTYTRQAVQPYDLIEPGQWYDTTATGRGYVLLKYRGSWGAVCASSMFTLEWDDRAAAAACRTLGYDSGRALLPDDSSTPRPLFLERASDYWPMWLTDVTCSSGSRDLINDCAYRGLWDGQIQDCSQGEMAAVECFGVGAEAPTPGMPPPPKVPPPPPDPPSSGCSLCIAMFWADAVQQSLVYCQRYAAALTAAVRTDSSLGFSTMTDFECEETFSFRVAGGTPSPQYTGAPAYAACAVIDLATEERLGSGELQPLVRLRGMDARFKPPLLAPPFALASLTSWTVRSGSASSGGQPYFYAGAEACNHDDTDWRRGIPAAPPAPLLTSRPGFGDWEGFGALAPSWPSNADDETSWLPLANHDGSPLSRFTFEAGVGAVNASGSSLGCYAPGRCVPSREDLTASARDAALVCIKMPGCAGFTTEGWLLSAADVASPVANPDFVEPNQGLYKLIGAGEAPPAPPPTSPSGPSVSAELHGCYNASVLAAALNASGSVLPVLSSTARKPTLDLAACQAAGAKAGAAMVALVAWPLDPLTVERLQAELPSSPGQEGDSLTPPTEPTGDRRLRRSAAEVESSTGTSLDVTPLTVSARAPAQPLVRAVCLAIADPTALLQDPEMGTLDSAKCAAWPCGPPGTGAPACGGKQEDVWALYEAAPAAA